MPRFAKYEENDEPVEGYKLVDFLGAGQFGEVWKAQEIATKKLVAIKMIDLSHSSSALKELKALNLVINLNHPNLVPIYTARLKDKNGKEMPLNKADEIKQKGQLRELIIAMGLGERSLSSRLKQLNPDGTDPDDFKGIPLDELIGYMQGAAKGIDYLNKVDHGLGAGDGPIVHCDIKPDNMMIVAGEVQIADCGVAVIITPDARQTKAAGSPAYSAPELTGNKPVPGTDQYALAISYYELRTGKLPFDEQMGQLSIMLAHAEGRLDFSSNVLSENEIKVLKWATAVRPKERYASCSDMVKQLLRALEDMQPLPPDQVAAKSMGLAVPKPRKKPVNPADVRSAPHLPKPDTDTARDSGDISFDPPARDELRGTMIPDSDRILPPEPHRPPAGPPRRDPAPMNFEASYSEIMIPTTPDTDGLDDPDAPDSPHTTISAQSTTRPPDSNPGNMQSLIVSRPQINVDQDDPMGAKAGAVELDPEIAKIIRASAVNKTPPARQTSSAPPAAPPQQRPTSNPVIVPPVSPGRRSTQYPRETPDESESPKSLPPWAKEAERERQKFEQSASHEIAPSAWKPPAPSPTAGGNPATKFIIGGVLAAGVAGGIAFLTMGGGGSSSKAPEPPPPPPLTNTTTKPDAALIAEIDSAITNAKDQPAIDAVQSRIAGLSGETYKAEKDRWKTAIEQRVNGFSTVPPPPMYDIEAVVKGITNTIQLAEKSNDLSQLAKAEADTKQIKDEFKARRQDLLNKIDAVRLNMTDREFADTLKELEQKTPLQIKLAATQLSSKYIKASQQEQIGRKLLEIADKKKEFRDPVILILLENERYTQLTPSTDDQQRVLAWKADDLAPLLVTAQKNITALGEGAEKDRASEIAVAQNSIKEIKTKIDDMTKQFGKLWNPKAVSAEMQAFLAVAEKWSAAREKPSDNLKALGDLVQKDLPPILPAALAKEYLRIATQREVSINNLRTVRDASQKWSSLDKAQKQQIDDLYQSALSADVYKVISSTTEPDWNALTTILGADPANGWAKAVAAEKAIAAKQKPETILPLLNEAEKFTSTDPTEKDRKAYIAYLRAITNKDAAAATELLKLYQSPIALLTKPARKKLAAEILAAVALTTPKEKLRPEQLLDGKSNPYKRNEAALSQLKKADELAGKDHPEWAIPLALLADASDDKTLARDASSRVVLDEAKVTDDQLPVALAFYQRRASDTQLPDAQRVPAYAVSGRLAYRVLELSFADCKTGDDVLEVEDILVPKIVTFVQEGLSLSGNNQDKLSLRLSIIRDDILRKSANAAWQERVLKELNNLVDGFQPGHPDRADAYAFRAFATLMRFSARLGNLKDEQNNESPARKEAWDQMLKDARRAVELEPDNSFAHRVIGYAAACEYGQYSAYIAPTPLRTNAISNEARVKEAIASFEKATEGLKTRKNTNVWFIRGKFLFTVANDYAKGGNPTLAKKYLADAIPALRNADLQRKVLRYDEPKTLGCALEDLAWLGGVEPAKNFAEALKALATKRDSASTAFVPIDGKLDSARCLIRAVEYAGVPKARLSEAATLLDEVEANREPLAAHLIPTAKFWRGVMHRLNGKYAEADKAFAEAIEGRVPLIAAQVPLWKAVRAETALDGLEAGVGEAATVTKLATDLAGEIASDVADSEPVQQVLSYVPDYLKARVALAKNDTSLAATHFAKVASTLQTAITRKELRVEKAFPFNALVLEAKNCAKELKMANANADRKALIGKLADNYGFILNPEQLKKVQAIK